jgi:hypothetical protein
MMKPIVTLRQHPQWADWIVIVIIDLARHSALKTELCELNHATWSVGLTLKQYIAL